MNRFASLRGTDSDLSSITDEVYLSLHAIKMPAVLDKPVWHGEACEKTERVMMLNRPLKTFVQSPKRMYQGRDGFFPG
jgi:hypothetical protein